MRTYRIEISDHDCKNTDTGTEARDEFLYKLLLAMSHDVRSPLVTIGARLNLMKRGSFGAMDDSVSEEVANLSEICLKTWEMAEEYLGQIFLLARTEKIETHDIDLNLDIVESVLNEMAEDLAEHEIVIENRLNSEDPEQRLSIKGYPVLLKNVFRNLVTNTIKYGGRGCTLGLGAVGQNDHICVNVFNTGPPISEKSEKRLFKKPVSLPRKNKKGMGLGLHLNRKIIRSYGGEMWYKSIKGMPHFFFTLPLGFAQK